MNLIHRNLLIMHKDIKLIKELGEAYIKHAPKHELKDATLLVKCRIIYTQIDYEFAAGNIKAKEELFTKRLNTELVCTTPRMRKLYTSISYPEFISFTA